MRILPPISGRRRDDGFATVAVLAILAIMCLLLMVNADSVKRAFREVRLVEQRQLQQHRWLITNTVVAPVPPK